MNILFINPNRHDASAKPPLGLISLGTVCKQAGHHVQIQDQNIPAGIETPELDVIGITCMTPTYPEALRLAESFQSLRPKTKIIIGGVHPTIFPDEVWQTGLFDAVVAGEGENSILQILNDIKHKSMRGIYKFPVEYPTVPLPDYSLINITDYKPRPPHGVRQPWTAVSLSRGCPYQCQFCSRAVFGHKFRAVSAMRSVCLMETLATKHGVKDITFYDDEFTLDRQRVMDFCKLLSAKHLDLTWTCEARVNLVDQELLRNMRLAGCRLIYYGIESGSQRILDFLQKNQTLAQIQYAVSLTRQAAIQAAGYFIIGCPTETKADIRNTIDLADSLGLNHAQFSACSPLPGSALYDLWCKTSGKKIDWSKFGYLGQGEKYIFTSDRLSASYIENTVQEANEKWQKGVLT